jgi:tRNA threonylcarbamoyladenosine biosynthesis protein TsaE
LEATFHVEELSDLKKVAQSIVSMIGGPSVVLLHGDLGSGKTTLVNEICGILGVTDSVSSPTFSIVNEYRTSDGKDVYHMDLYRLEDLDEIRSTGFSEYLSSGNWCFVEWPAMAGQLLDSDFVLISIKNDNGKRIFEVSAE